MIDLYFKISKKLKFFSFEVISSWIEICFLPFVQCLSPETTEFEYMIKSTLGELVTKIDLEGSIEELFGEENKISIEIKLKMTQFLSSIFFLNESNDQKRQEFTFKLLKMIKTLHINLKGDNSLQKNYGTFFNDCSPLVFQLLTYDPSMNYLIYNKKPLKIQNGEVLQFIYFRFDKMIINERSFKELEFMSTLLNLEENFQNFFDKDFILFLYHTIS